MLHIVIYAFSELEFINLKNHCVLHGFTEPNIIWCDSRVQDRTKALNSVSAGSWVLFLDADCALNINTVLWLKSKCSEKIDKNTVCAGVYKNPSYSNLVQQSHNFIANNWVLASYELNQPKKVFLGGAFLVYLKSQFVLEAEIHFWGGEDKKLAYQLNQAGFDFIYEPNIQIVHNTTKSLYRFLKRAFIHGKNEIKYLEKNENNINYRFWFRKIGFANLRLFPLIVLHFCMQKVGLYSQKVLQMNKPKLLK